MLKKKSLIKEKSSINLKKDVDAFERKEYRYLKVEKNCRSIFQNVFRSIFRSILRGFPYL